MYAGGMLEALARAAAEEEFARAVAQAREEAVQGVGSYKTSVPNMGTGDVPVQFTEPGLEAPFIDPVDLMTGGMGGAVTGVERSIAERAARQLADPFGDMAKHYGGKAAKNFAYDMLDKDVKKQVYGNALHDARQSGNAVSKSFEKGMKRAAEERKAEFRAMGDTPFEPRWNRTTRLTPEYGGSTAGAIVDSNPYLRTEPSRMMMQTTTGKGSWVNDAFPYVERGRRSGAGRMANDISDRLYDRAAGGDMSWETAGNLLDMLYRR